MSEPILLRGPDAGNPLGYMAVLGTLRVATRVWPDRRPALAWTQRGSGWRALLRIEGVSQAELVSGLQGYLRYRCTTPGQGDHGPEPERAFPHFAHKGTGEKASLVGNAKKFDPGEFRRLLSAARKKNEVDPDAAAHLVALACDAVLDYKGRLEATPLHFLDGSSKQHHFVAVLELVRQVSPAHIHHALFEAWRYDEPSLNLTLRWDPTEIRRHADQWHDPSQSTGLDREKTGGMIGANRLAVEAFPFFPPAPVRTSGKADLRTTAVTGKSAGAMLTWPLWERFATADVVGSLIAHPLLLKVANASGRGAATASALERLGVTAVLRAEAINVAKSLRNFTGGQVVWLASRRAAV